MKKLIYILVVMVAFALGVYVGRMPIMALIIDDTAGSAMSVSDTAPANKKATLAADEKVAAPEDKSQGVVVPIANLSEGQKRLLSLLGIDASELTITPAMIACAESKVGATRLKEIEGGAAPSFSEGLSLLACYK